MSLCFEDIVIDVERRELTRAGGAVHVEPQVFDLLVYLVANRDRVVSKDDVIDAVWGGRIVSDSTLTSRINAARRAVGDSGESQKLIRTIARKGFRFVGVVQSAVVAADAAAPAEPAAPLPLPDKPAIAVLPFTNMSDDPQQEYFSDGISEDIITALSKLRWFFVVSRNSSFTYKNRAVNLKQVGDELGVGYVVEGSVRKDGNRVRITAQLVNAETGAHLWAERYDRDLADVFAVQDEITQAVVAAIEPQLLAAEDFRARAKGPDCLDAWDLTMRALSHYWRITRTDNVVAQALLEKAAALDPGYGHALGVLSWTHTLAVHLGWAESGAVLDTAERAAVDALRADSEDPWAHHALANVRLFQRRFDDSLAAVETAIRLNPSFAVAQAYYGLVLTYAGRWEEGEQAVRRALRLSPRDPLSALYYGMLSYAQYCGRNYDEAIRNAREGVRQRGDFTGGLRVALAAAGMLGREEVAREILPELRRAQPNISLAWIADSMPIMLDADREHYLEGFRRAGLR
jgi:TolB-like protein